MQKNTRMGRKKVLDEAVLFFGSQINLAKFLKLNVYVIQKWLDGKGTVYLDYILPIFFHYKENGYVVKLLYRKRPEDTEVKPNTLYLYLLEGELEYAVINVMGKIKRIKISSKEMEKHFKAIKFILKDEAEKKALEDAQFAALSRLIRQRGYVIKKWSEFSVKDWVSHLNIPLGQLAVFVEAYLDTIPISQRVVELRKDMASTASCLGRKKKNMDPSANTFKGKKILLYFGKWLFKSPDEYFRAARVVDYGCAELMSAMDDKRLTISAAARKVKLLVEEKKQFLGTLDKKTKD